MYLLHECVKNKHRIWFSGVIINPLYKCKRTYNDLLILTLVVCNFYSHNFTRQCDIYVIIHNVYPNIYIIYIIYKWMVFCLFVFFFVLYVLINYCTVFNKSYINRLLETLRVFVVFSTPIVCYRVTHTLI